MKGMNLVIFMLKKEGLEERSLRFYSIRKEENQGDCKTASGIYN